MVRWWHLAALLAVVGPANGADLSLQRIMLSSGGVGYFEYEATVDGNATLSLDVRIASPEMFPEAEMLPHLICSRPMFIGGAKDEADQHGSARRVGGSDSRAVCARGPG